jgi:hypothetical protein
MRSVWICTRNDALRNMAVILAALGVFGTATAWPDLLVVCATAALALSGARTALRHAKSEMRGVIDFSCRRSRSHSSCAHAPASDSLSVTASTVAEIPVDSELICPYCGHTPRAHADRHLPVLPSLFAVPITAAAEARALLCVCSYG